MIIQIVSIAASTLFGLTAIAFAIAAPKQDIGSSALAACIFMAASLVAAFVAGGM